MLKYCESFDHITAASLAALGWGGDTNRQILAGAGRGGSNLLDLNVTLTYNVGPSHFTLPRSCSRMVVGFAFTRKADYYGNSNFYVQFCYGDYENFRVQVALSASGLTFNFWTGNGSGYPAIPSSAYVSAPFVQTNAFTFVEILVDVTDFMNGRVKCGVNGKVAHDQTGIATAAYTGFGSNPFDPRAKINRVQFNNTLRMDSIYICDDEGGYHNDFLGDIFVKTLYPLGDGEQVAWEPYVNGLPAPDGTVRTELIDDPVFNPDVEQDYIQSAQDLAQETMWFPGTAELPSSSTIVAVNHRTAARSVASPGTPPPNTLIPLYKSSGNEIVITNSLAKKLVGWTYQFLDVYYNLVPVLTVDWTKLLLEGSQFGFMLREPIWTGLNLEEACFEDEVIDE